MKSSVFSRLLEIINEEQESFKLLIDADNVLNLNVNFEDILNFIEFAPLENLILAPIVGNVIITEGDILSILKIIHDISKYEGEYTLFINGDNLGTITYLVSRANKAFQNLGKNVFLKIDYSDNYNAYLDVMVTIIGSETFIETSKNDFSKYNSIIV